VPFAPPNLLISLESLGSNPTLSAIQSEVQRNPPRLLQELQEMGAISRFLLSNRTGESVLLIADGKLCSLFLQSRGLSFSTLDCRSHKSSQRHFSWGQCRKLVLQINTALFYWSVRQ
jgi:hypothetical protein